MRQNARLSPTRAVTATGVLAIVLAGSGLVTGLFSAPAGWAVAGGRWLDFYGGVFALVALSLATLAGLGSRDRVMVSRRMRLRLQNAHRTLAVATLGFLAVHIVTRVADGQVRVVDAAVPFLSGRLSVAAGLGTVAAYLLVVVASTGVARGWFGARGSRTLWTAVHAGGYLAWPIAIFHGLMAGRHPSVAVMLGYAACLLTAGVLLTARWVLGIQAPLRITFSAERLKPKGHPLRTVGAALVLVVAAMAVGAGETAARIRPSLQMVSPRPGPATVVDAPAARAVVKRTTMMRATKMTGPWKPRTK